MPAGCSTRSTSCASGRATRRVTSASLATGDDHALAIVEACRNVPGVVVERVSTGPSCCTSAARSRWCRRSPVKTRDDLSMAYTPGVARVCLAIAKDRERVWNLTMKQQHRRRRGAMARGARARRHRSRRGDAGDGGQGAAVQGVRRRRRVADVPRDQGPRSRSSPPSRRSRPVSAASTSRTSPRRAASRSSGGCSASLDIPVFHDDSTAPRSSHSRRS